MYDEKQLDQLIEDWHESPNDARPLYEFLGWTKEEYGHWIETGQQP